MLYLPVVVQSYRSFVFFSLPLRLYARATHGCCLKCYTYMSTSHRLSICKMQFGFVSRMLCQNKCIVKRGRARAVDLTSYSIQSRFTNTIRDAAHNNSSFVVHIYENPHCKANVCVCTNTHSKHFWFEYTCHSHCSGVCVRFHLVTNKTNIKGHNERLHFIHEWRAVWQNQQRW